MDIDLLNSFRSSLKEIEDVDMRYVWTTERNEIIKKGRGNVLMTKEGL
jgi:hypothetical protein